MAIETKIIENPSKTNVFPKLMGVRKQYSKEGFYVILFSGENKGMVVASKNKYRPIGYYSDAWETDCFEEFNGTVESKNV